MPVTIPVRLEPSPENEVAVTIPTDKPVSLVLPSPKTSSSV